MSLLRQITIALVLVVALVVSATPAKAFGGRCCGNRPGLIQRIKENIQERREARQQARAGTTGNPGCTNCGCTQATSGASSVTRTSACEFGCQPGNAPCWPPAPTAGVGRIVLSAPLPIPACPNGVCPKR